MGLLTVFANFRIDSEERFLRMQDSFYSFRDADVERWVINVRGSYRKQVASFLESNLNGNLKLYELESPNGWFFDSRQMLSDIESEYVFFWVEDHLCIGGVDYFNSLIREMYSFQIEYLLYSWFSFGEILKCFEQLEISHGETLVHLTYDKMQHKAVNESYRGKFYIISCCSITSYKLFTSIISANDPILKRWPKQTPFDFEKSHRDIHWLPLKYAVPKHELFASIDDDLHYPGYSLIARKLYPDRLKRDSLLEIRKENLEKENQNYLKAIKYFLKSNQYLYGLSLFNYKLLIEVRECINSICSKFIKYIIAGFTKI